MDRPLSSFIDIKKGFIAVFKMVEIDVDHATQKTHNKNTNDRQSRDI